MNNRVPQAIPAQLTKSKGTNLFRELFTSNLWMSGLAMLMYIPRSFRVKQVDGMAFSRSRTSMNLSIFKKQFSRFLVREKPGLFY